MGLLVILLLWSVACCNSHSLLRAPCVFRTDEVDMHKYAAILAATEPYRVEALSLIKKSTCPMTWMHCALAGKSLFNVVLPMRSYNKNIDVACEQYLSRVADTLRSYRMTTIRFNEISDYLQHNRQRRGQVLKQAYYYRITADLEANLRPTLPVLPPLSSIDKDNNSLHIASDPLKQLTPPSPKQRAETRDDMCDGSKDIFADYSYSRSTKDFTKDYTKPTPPPPSPPPPPPPPPLPPPPARDTTQPHDTPLPSFPPSNNEVDIFKKQKQDTLNNNNNIRYGGWQAATKLERFASALHAIEQERLRYRQHIKMKLQLQELPKQMFDPKLMAAMNPVIQNASVAFPKTASSIIRQHRLLEDEFSKLQKKVKRNPIFCLRVHKELKRLDSKGLYD